MREKKKLLIVDDSKTNRKILSKILESDYELLEAENGATAMEIMNQEKESISAILLDLTMPVMNGYEVMEAMHRNAFLSQIPVIVTTASSDSQTEDKALSLGANDFLLKPYKPSVMKHRIENMIKLRESAALINSVQRDELTGLLKKEFFYQQVWTILTSHPDQKYDILTCDIERFRLVNDLFGTQVGDQLLRYTAKRLKYQIPNEVISSRIGVDQFACLVLHPEQPDNKVLERFIKEINCFPIQFRLNLSFGIYEISDLSVPVNMMCDRSILACNSIKGKYDINFAVYNEKLRQELLLEQSVIDNMQTGIQEKQFQIYYQPKYDISTEKVCGAEALVRWIHPQKGVIPPDQFIPLFEKNGFITELDYYVWDTVCATMQRWMQEKKKMTPISVNMSRTDIYNPQLPDILIELIHKYQLKPAYLHLEITETAYTEDPHQLIEAVNELKRLGFIIEMDDFGSGYSSLNMLSQMPLDVLKLDMGFVRNETAKNGGKNILGFVISLAKWLNLSVIAEGVETEGQLEALRNVNCNYVQGYYYAKPMPLAEFEAHLLQADVNDIESGLVNYKDNTGKIIMRQNASDRVILIVDDVEINRAVLSEIFSDFYTIVEASDGKTAYEYAVQNSSKIDVILLDLVMPVMDGFQLLDKLKHDTRLMEIPVIVTSQTGEDGEARALSMGAADFISKPYNTDVAQHRVNNVLAESKLRHLEREKQMETEIKEMRYKAEHDSLTGLYNRTALETYINAFFSNSKEGCGSFIMIDIDNFKTINDVFGHDKGDETLIGISKILVQQFRKTDIVARLGGDEFAVFVPTFLAMEELKKKANMLCKKLQLQYGGVEITASAGVSVAPQQGIDYQTLYKNADRALLAAKRLGKNQYLVFDEEIEMPSPVLTRNLDWLLDETSDAVMVCDTENYDLLYLNHVACEICGKSRKEILGKKCYEAFWENKEPCSFCVPLDKMTKTYCEHELNDPLRKKNYLVKGKLTEWGGKTARIQFIMDNTRRSLAVKRLADTSDDRKRLLDLMPGGIFRYKAGEDDSFDFVSKNMLKMLGYTKEEFEQKFQNHFSNLIWHEDRERVRKEIENQIAVGNTDECEYRIEKADKSLCWVHDSGQFVLDESGQPWFYVAIMDITKEHNMTDQLEEERKKLQIALSHTKLQYWEHDLKTDVAINGVKGAELGFDDVTPNYSHFLLESGIIPKEYIALYQEKQQALYDGAECVEYDIPLFNPDAKRSWWHICCTNLFDENGKPVKTIGTAENIDWQKK